MAFAFASCFDARLLKQLRVLRQECVEYVMDQISAFHYACSYSHF